jgi:short subunit dehydrogenase-like uncharacterized protein
MASRIVVFGATGYTGELIASRLVAAGAAPVLAGRSEQRLAALASRLGGLDVVRADAMRQNTVFELVSSPDDVLISTVGPFSKWGQGAVRAAVAAGCTYLDTTGEPGFIRRGFDEFGPPAARSGARLLTALGYDYAPGALAGALALDEAGSDAVRVDVGYYATGEGIASLSAGTRESMVGVTFSDGFAFRDGALRTVRPAERVRTFPVAGRPRDAFSVGGAEHFGLPAAFPGLLEVNVYLGVFGPLSRPFQAGSLVGSIVQRVPLATSSMRFFAERAASLLPGPEAGSTSGGRVWVVGEALAAGGSLLARVSLAGPDAYAFTASFVAWAARQRVEGAGALGPVEAFGLERFEAGAAEAGLERVR